MRFLFVLLGDDLKSIAAEETSLYPDFLVRFKNLLKDNT